MSPGERVSELGDRVETARLVLRVAFLRFALPARMQERSLRALLEELSSSRSSGTPSAASIERIEAITERLLRKNRFLHTTCLYRALVRYSLLREVGLDVKFVMGVRNTGQDLVGHAWIETEGEPFREVLGADYAKTFAHPP